MAFAAAVAALLLAGAGCTAQTNTEAGLEARPPAPEGVMKAKTEGSVDATIDDILKDGDDEQEMLRGSESDAAELDADKAELNAYGEGTYELK